MHRATHAIEIFLQPGEFYFGGGNTRIRTLLGSCVSITMWQPTQLIGGMCHYMLPSRSGRSARQLDGRYGDEAILMFLREAMRHESDPNSFVVKVFGGGNMFHHDGSTHPCAIRPCREAIQSCRNVACKNTVRGITLLEDLGFVIEAHDLGGSSSRNIFFDISNGHVWVRKNQAAKGKA